mgnify:CR=1 FL=1
MLQETTFIRNQGNITVLSDLLTSLDQCDGFCEFHNICLLFFHGNMFTTIAKYFILSTVF